MKQWVNLDRREVFLSDGIDSLDRLGPVRFVVTFEKKEAALARVERVAADEKAKYTSAELARNGRFAGTTSVVPVLVDLDDEESKEAMNSIEVVLPPAGGNKYKLEAKAGEKTVKTVEDLETWRRLFVHCVKMGGIQVPDRAPSWKRFKDHFLEIVEPRPIAEVPHAPNLNSATWGKRLKIMKGTAVAYALGSHEPYAAAALFADMLGYMNTTEFDLPVDRSPHVRLKGRVGMFGDDEAILTVPDRGYLWFGLDAEDDARNGGRGIWLVPGSASFIPETGAPLPIPDDHVTIDTSVRRSAAGGYNTVKIKLPAEKDRTVFGTKGRIAIRLRLLKGFSGGYSEPSYNFITIAQRAWFGTQPDPDSERLQVLVHELGHKIGMVPKGTAVELDAPGTLYGKDNTPASQKAHQGPHCENGATYVKDRKASEWTGTPKCVMFGATSCYDPAQNKSVPTTDAFCEKCGPLVDRLDLDGRHLDSFRNSITTL